MLVTKEEDRSEKRAVQHGKHPRGLGVWFAVEIRLQEYTGAQQDVCH